MRAYKVNEFVQSKEIKTDIGINVLYKKSIDDWFDEWTMEAEYTIDDNLNIIVNGDLYLYNMNVTKLPDNLEVTGSLSLQKTKIIKLPDNLIVGETLYLNYSSIEELPRNLTVGGDLDIEGTKISELPDDLNVGGEIYKDF